MPGPDTWNERIGVTRTIRENILLYLSEVDDAVEQEKLQSTIGITRDAAAQHMKFLKEHRYVEKQISGRSMRSEYTLTDKGDELVADIRWGDDT